MSAQVKPVKRDDVNKYCSVGSGAGLEVKHIVRECLISFPSIWVSVVRVLTYDKCLTILDVA